MVMVELLAHRTWYNVRLAALAHGFRFDTKQSKQQGCDSVRHRLLEEGHLRQAYRRLSADEREPLLALQMVDGVLPLHHFTARFGQIRPYKPWQEHGLRYSWKRPISAAEKLWHLGMIEIVRGKNGIPDSVVLPDEVCALLPPVPLPEIVRSPAENGIEYEVGSLRTAFVRDLAALLSGIVAGEVRWMRRGRVVHWLTPRSMQALNRRLILPEALAHIRSERQTGRLRFLHYVLCAAAFLEDDLPTQQVWDWLAQPNRWDTLWDAIGRDLRLRESWWTRFELPAITAQAWERLVATFKTLQPDQAYTLDSIYTCVRFDLSRATFDKVLATVFTWSGWVMIQDGALSVCPQTDDTQPAQITLYKEGFDLHLPPLPALRSLVEVSAWAEIPAADMLRVTPAAVRRGMELGYHASTMIQALADLLDKPIPAAAAEKIQRWAQEAASLTMQSLTVLTCADAAALQRIRADWRLRPLTGALLSPHHLVIQTDQADLLRRKLAQRGFALTVPESSTPDSQSRTQTEATYLYLAISLYRQLAQFTPLESPIPGDVVRGLRQQLSPERVEAVEQSAGRMVDNLRRTMTGQQVARGGIAQNDPTNIEQTIQAAHQQRTAVTVRYYSPYTGEETTRTIEPTMLYTRNGARYIEAWCQLDEAERTFRMDRILAIL